MELPCIERFAGLEQVDFGLYPPMRFPSLQAGDCVPAGSHCTSEAAPPAFYTPSVAKPLRLRHVDSLRALAAGMVAWTHLGPDLLPFTRHNPTWLAFLSRLPATLALGRLGVDVFFAISGFVICHSFGGSYEGSSRRFLIRRFCRLYPVFWVSVAAGVCVAWLGGQLLPLSTIAANLTMTPVAFGQPAVIGLYWTLNIELIFYGLCLVLHRLGWLDRRGTLVACILVFAGTRRTLHLVTKLMRFDVNPSEECGVWLLSLALMFWGALFRMVYEETGGFRQAPWRRAGPWLLLLVTLFMLDVLDPRLKTTLLHKLPGQWGEGLVTLNSLVLFTLWIAWLRVEARLLTYVGMISYSLYLFHPLVSELFARSLRRLDVGLPLWVVLTVAFACSIAVATALYRWVERPSIAFGKRWVELGAVQSSLTARFSEQRLAQLPKLLPSGKSSTRVM